MYRRTRFTYGLWSLSGAVAASLVIAGQASATIATVPNDNSFPNAPAGDIVCTAQLDPENAAERWCSGIFTTFDGAPIDVNIGFPPAPTSGADGNFPIVGVFHGWGGSKLGLGSSDLQQWLNDGYAVFSMSDRGWGNSCGGTDPKRLQPVCANGYNHLMDTRYEVRDAQEVFEALADRDATGATAAGLIDPQRIASMGSSYGGGISMALGALRDRKMMGGELNDPVNPPNGTLVPWVSPEGKAMKIAAAAPDIPWSDLAASLQPNGSTLDYVADAPYLGLDGKVPIGVEKRSFVSGLFATGAATSNYAPPGTDRDADLINWYSLINAGEPYDQNPLSADIVDELTRHHSAYYIDHSVAPAPMLISNGWTDDLFPPDEAIRFYNRTRSQYPSNPVSLIFSDHGHQRGQNKSIDARFLNSQVHAWFDHYVKGDGPAPFNGVQTLTQTCPSTAPSGGATGPFDDLATDRPFRAPNWAAIAPGEVRFQSAASKTIVPGSSSPTVSQPFDPIAGGGACATAPAADQSGTATYRLDPAPAGGYTLMGSPTVVAKISSTAPTSEVVAHLFDVDRDAGTETLVARGILRVGDDPPPVFQLHPNGWKFAKGHIAKLELLPSDEPYARASNVQSDVTVSKLDLRLPVLEAPAALGPVDAPAPKVLPPDYVTAPDVPEPPVTGPGGGDSPGSCAKPARVGSRKGETLRGTAGADTIAGKRGADRLRGRGGDDCLNGNQGRDRVTGGGGNDLLRGGAGNDTIRGGRGSDTVNCGQGRHDVAIVEQSESATGCERVRRP
jgi:predicted acyl esterase